MNPVRPGPVLKRLDEKQQGVAIDPALLETPSSPHTPRKQEDCKRLFEQLLNETLPSPAARRVRLLQKGTTLIATELEINKHQLLKYEKYKTDKSTNKRLLSKGSVFTADDAKRLLNEKASKGAKMAAREHQAAYLEGTWMPEVAVSRQSHAVINPGEAGQAHEAYCHVFWAAQQPP
ncbi:hypothetical protein BDV96DRAFT_695000 [Lophiotrema nucula]|uniref:Uncharacterized protein n=1 Tax=Lophiotrema nucula TaxID=690887 RepID=A0A6A5YDU6_9PLEO|nr:hypothetical protein BDV96DRAFT_695000 [Lophiotrema nucula]